MCLPAKGAPRSQSVCLAPFWLTVEKPPIILLPWAVKLQVYSLWPPHYLAHMKYPHPMPSLAYSRCQ